MMDASNSIAMKWLCSTPVNVVVNNLFWAGCVIGRYELLWLVAPAVLCYVALLLYCGVVRPGQLLVPVAAGILMDSVFTASGIFQFEHHAPILPLWMWTLWLAFATTLPLSLRLLGRHRFLAAVTGALGFPFSYYLGFQLDAVRFGLSLPATMMLVALTWAVLLPLFFKWIDSYQETANEAI